ncbi:MAG TPA: LXG domain-containing protein [Pseudogracilibacillus sp.]|nr:LXG domain-containing protein [Pseudogracilibacillus sp.]
MKVLDVMSLQRDIDKTIRYIEDKRSQVEEVQRAIRDFHALGDALTGEAGDAIRNFFKDYHETFLIFLHQSLIDYESALNAISDAIEAFESDSNGYVSRIFLEGQVTAGFNRTGRQAKKFANDTNDIIDDISDLVSISAINESEVMNHVRKGKETTDEIIADLIEMDNFTSLSLEDTQNKLQKMIAFISEVESKYVDGSLSIGDYNLTDARQSDAFRDITKSVYGEHGLIEILLGKHNRGEPLTEAEMEILYDFYQGDFLDDHTRRKLETIASYLEEESIDQLKEHLNESVVTSDIALEEEIALVEAYLFLGTNSPDETDVDIDIRYDLQAYLTLLNGYQSHVDKNDSVILVEDITYYKNKHNVVFLNTEFKHGEHTGDGHTVTKWVDDELTEYKIKDKDDFRDWLFFSSGHSLHAVDDDSINIISSAGSNAANDIRNSEIDDITKKLDDHGVNYTVEKIVEKAASVLADKANVGDYLEFLTLFVGYDIEKEGLNDEKTAKESLALADDLELSYSTTKTESEKHAVITYTPTEGTFMKLERWKELHDEDPNIPYPAHAIQQGDWVEVKKQLVLVGDLYGERIDDFINGSTNKTAEELVKEWDE